MRVGGTVEYLKGGGAEQRGGDKYFKKGGKLSQGVDALKRGDWNPFTNYDCLGSFLSVRPVAKGEDNWL